MKDPLRYYIAEGLVTMLYWLNPRQVELHQPAFIGKFFFDERVRITRENGTQFKLPTVTIDGATYPVCDDFYLDYGTLAVDAADAAIVGSSMNVERATIHAEFQTMIPQLAEYAY